MMYRAHFNGWTSTLGAVDVDRFTKSTVWIKGQMVRDTEDVRFYTTAKEAHSWLIHKAKEQKEYYERELARVTKLLDETVKISVS